MCTTHSPICLLCLAPDHRPQEEWYLCSVGMRQCRQSLQLNLHSCAEKSNVKGQFCQWNWTLVPIACFHLKGEGELEAHTMMQNSALLAGLFLHWAHKEVYRYTGYILLSLQDIVILSTCWCECCLIGFGQHEPYLAKPNFLSCLSTLEQHPSDLAGSLVCRSDGWEGGKKVTSRQDHLLQLVGMSMSVPGVHWALPGPIPSTPLKAAYFWCEYILSTFQDLLTYCFKIFFN